MKLEEQFKQEVLDGCKLLSKKHGYNPTYFLRMVHEHGAVTAAKLLLASKEPSEGLFKLWELRQLEMSIEAMALSPRFRSLFTKEELLTAKRRLDDMGYTPPDK